MDRHVRFKMLRAIWARARAILPFQSQVAQEDRLRAQYWRTIQVAGRLVNDGVIRGAEDPDTRRPAEDLGRQWAARQAQVQAQQEWADHQQRQWRQQHGRQS